LKYETEEKGYKKMKLIRPSYSIEGIYGTPGSIEIAGRTCYKSEEKITSDSANKMVKSLIKRGHHSVIEHSLLSVRFICDRGVTHELVRHRLCAFSQESTRYWNYANKEEIAVIEPYFFDPYEEMRTIKVPMCGTLRFDRDNPYNSGILGFGEDYKIYSMNSFDVWFLTCLWTQWGYMTLVNEFKKKPQQARSVLPNSTKTEIVMTANFREWRHIFTLRCSKAAHPQMREVMVPLLQEMKELRPVFFEDIPEE